jgi:hypothetical protein
MSVDVGPKLGLLINANIGENYVDSFRPFLRAIDELLFGNVLNSATTTPPGSPNNGDAYLLLGTPTGTWAGHGNAIAIWSTEITTSQTNTKVPGWEYRAPNAGWLIYDTAAALYRYFTGTAWLTFPKALLPNPVNLFPSNPGSFTVAHGLPTAPLAVDIEMSSGGQIWFQSIGYDATNLYLVASDSGVTGVAMCWE